MFSTRGRYFAKKATEAAKDTVTPKTTKRVVNHSMCEVTPAFSKIIGRTEATRPDAVKQFWAYIKGKKLQVRLVSISMSSIVSHRIPTKKAR